MSRSKTPRVVYDRSSGKVIYDELIRILSAMTGARWGYHRTFGVVSYIECEKYQIRVATGETRARKIDITLSRLDISAPEWEAAAAYELREKLIPIAKGLLPAIERYQIDPKFIAEITHISTHLIASTNPIVNKYIDECLYDIEITVNK